VVDVRAPAVAVVNAQGRTFLADLEPVQLVLAEGVRLRF
jgi:hypothetical protein